MNRVYTNLESVGSLAGLNQFRTAREKKRLREVDSYTKFREVKKVKRFNPIYTDQKREILQIDLIDMRHLKGANRNVQWLLCAIDSFSRKASVRALRRKTPAGVLLAFKSILNELGPPLPKQILADNGSEWKGVFKRFLQEKKIKMIIPNEHASTVERFQKTFQSHLYKYLHEFKTKKYIHIIHKIVQTYNQKIHRSIKMSPNEADQPRSRAVVMSNLLDFYNRNHPVSGKKKKILFQRGDVVRVALKKNKFSRSYQQTFSDSLFMVVGVKKHLPVPMYVVYDLDARTLVPATFYAEELQHFSNETLHIEETGKTRKNDITGELEKEVVFDGFSKQHKLFLPESKILDWTGQQKHEQT